MKKKLSILTLLFSAFFLNSCSDDTTEDPTPKAKTKTELLCSSPWKTTALNINPALDIGGTQVSDWYAQMDACDKDDLDKFESNKTGFMDEGPTKCDPSDPQSIPFTWTFDLTEKILTYDGDSYELVELSETTMIVKYTLDGDDIGGVSGLKYTLTGTMKH